MGDVKKFIKSYNIVMPALELFKPKSCEYYLHYSVMLPYTEEQTQTKFVEKSTVRQIFFQTILIKKVVEFRTGLFFL